MAMQIIMTIHHDLDPHSGAPGVTHRLAEAYRARGHAVQVLSFSDLPAGLPIPFKSIAFPFYVAWKIERLRREGAVHVVDASTGDAWLWSWIASSPRPLLVTRSHGLEHAAYEARVEDSRAGRLHLSWKYFLYWGGLHLLEVARTLRAADLVLLLNRHDRDYAVARLGVEADRIALVPNGLADAFLGRPGPPAEDAGPLRIAMVGSWLPHKGVEYATAALSSFLQRHPEARVSLFGTGASEENVLRELPTALHGRINVVPRFAQEDLPDLLEGHHALLFPSLTEGFGIAVIEAMACGLVPIVTAVPGPMEIVTHGVDGVVVPPRDPDALDRALEGLHQDRQRLGALRLAAQQRAQAFGWEAVADGQLDLYKEALAERTLVA